MSTAVSEQGFSLSLSGWPQRMFVTGTDTGVGKTLVSGMLAARIDAAYWKPIQTGAVEETDSSWIARICGLPRERLFPEEYLFADPVSPHLAAYREGKRIEISRVFWPESEFPVLAEGAGGLMVPLNQEEYMIDLMSYLNAPVLVVARSGLGTINHTLLTVDRLRSSGLRVFGVVLNGVRNRDNREAIEKMGRVKVLAEVDYLPELSAKHVREAGEKSFDHMWW